MRRAFFKWHDAAVSKVLSAVSKQFTLSNVFTVKKSEIESTELAVIAGRSLVTFLSLRMKRMSMSQRKVAAAPVHTRTITSMLGFPSSPGRRPQEQLVNCCSPRNYVISMILEKCIRIDN